MQTSGRRTNNQRLSSYDRSLAREFRYEWLFGEQRARCVTIDYDPSGSNSPEDWTLIEAVQLTDHIAMTPYQDATVSSEGQGGWLPPSESVAQFFAVAQHTLATSETRYFHGDLIDSAVLATDDVGAGAATLAYSAFGEPIGDGESLGTRYRYAGGWGYESGLVGLPGANADLTPITLLHVGARWYDPSIGRFVQRDPIGILGGINVYAYAFGNPLTGVDPSGLTLPDPPILFPNPGLPRGPNGWLKPIPRGMKVVWVRGQRVLLPTGGGAASTAAAGGSRLLARAAPVVCVVVIAYEVANVATTAVTGETIEDHLGKWAWRQFWPKPPGLITNPGGGMGLPPLPPGAPPFPGR
jgi:RHS repeat-associated protein